MNLCQFLPSSGVIYSQIKIIKMIITSLDNQFKITAGMWLLEAVFLEHK